MRKSGMNFCSQVQLPLSLRCITGDYVSEVQNELKAALQGALRWLYWALDAMDIVFKL